MLKRILVLILTVVLSASLLLGCSFFSHDNERDMQQEVARVSSYKIVNTVLDEDGESSEYPFVTEEKIIYKRDLLEYVNSNGDSLSSYFTSAEELYKYCVRMLINVELVANEVDALIAGGLVKWGVSEQNEIRRDLYNIVDSTLFSLKNNILSERGLEEIVKADGSASTADTTYPVKPEVTDTDDDDDDKNKTEPEVWSPDRVTWPGINGDSDARSLDREAMTRFIALIKSRVDGDFRLEKPALKWLKQKIDTEIKEIDKLIDTQGIEAVYPKIADYSYPMNDKDRKSKFGYIMYYLSGMSLERSQKLDSMQEYLTDRVSVKYDEVMQSYATTLNEQRAKFDADVSAYDSAVSDSSTTILYRPNNNYFYVKHILLPFSEKQTEDFNAYKSSEEITKLHVKEQEKKINEYREWLAQSIVCYPHVDGENDTTRPMSVDDVMEHVRSVMTPLAGNVKAANDAFNDLIYLYNTDPGAFGNDAGYVVKYKLAQGEGETYMQEFADAAREMYRNIEVGQVYSQKVITDYGVHIMYLASVTQKGAVSIYDATSPDGSQTYYDLLEAPIRTAREDASYNDWQNLVLKYNYDKYSKTFEDNYSDLWED